MLEYILVFIIASAVGSFLNVCIYRMPKNESVIMPGSHCPHCDKEISWCDNIPILSFLILGARCRKCKKKISIRYFIVELLTASLLLFLYVQFGFTLKFFIYAIIFSGLIVASFIDLEHQIIPDEISVGAIVLGLIVNVAFPGLHGFSNLKQSLIFSSLGILIGGGSLYITGMIGDFIFKKESMGGGDIKLLAGIGAFLGWKIALLVFFVAPLFGAIMGLIVKIRKKINVIPYGPFISLSTFVAVFWGDKIINWIFKY
ncbi:MAG: prepilin peptidase [Candidatus Omnitrophica bacterium]|nr:prepilin peptidase [Candidatus Omnitrophota bacterium]